MTELESEVVTVGSHVIVQRLNFKKVYRVSETGSLALGKEEIKMNTIIGKPYWTIFQIIGSQEKRSKGYKRNPPSTLVVADKFESLEDLRSSITSGYDNRSINDDGKSQKLSKDDILSFRDAGMTGREIITNLIENNKSFAEKTEYSQEKYIKKKEKKYFQYLSIQKPTVQLLHEIYLRQDATKIYGLRMDTLAQIFSYSDIKYDGKFLLYDSGTAGLVAAGLLSRIGSKTSGNLLYLHSGDHLPQMPILRAMNFPQEQFDRLIVVSIFDFLKMYHSKNKTENESSITVDTNIDNVTIEDDKLIDERCVAENKHECEEKNCDSVSPNDLKRKCNDENSLTELENKCMETNCDIANSTNLKKQCDNNDSKTEIKDEFREMKYDIAKSDNLKRKFIESSEEGPAVKKSRKILEIERAAELLSNSKADNLVIIAREHPLSITQVLLPFVKSSRPFVVYHAHREPLQELYVELKKQSNVINLKLFSNFLRSYQILPDRTHPDILMNDCGGYILTGYTVS